MKATIKLHYEWDDMPYLKQTDVDNFKQLYGEVSYDYEKQISEFTILDFLGIKIDNSSLEVIDTLYNGYYLDNLLDSEIFLDWLKEDCEDEAKEEYIDSL